MLEQDIKNFKIIDDLVSNYFSLDDRSIERFRVGLEDPSMEKSIREIFKDSKDLRARFPITEESFEDVDEGWTKFKHNFGDFSDRHDVTYENFRKNIVTIDKNDIKLGKALKKFYKSIPDIALRELHLELDDRVIQSLIEGWRNLSWQLPLDRLISYSTDSGPIFRWNSEKEAKTKIDEIIDSSITHTLEEIGALKLPKSSTELEVVISRNFADWFMCSTAENWTSCLSLQSSYESAYWSGLPGLIVDPNRVMIYVTDGSKKSYQGIEVDKMIQRTWALVDDDSFFHPLAWYESKKVSNKVVREVTGLPLKLNTGRDFETPVPFVLMRFEDGNSCFPYQDNSQFESELNEFGEVLIFGKGESDFFFFNKNDDLIFNSLFNIDFDSNSDLECGIELLQNESSDLRELSENYHPHIQYNYSRYTSRNPEPSITQEMESGVALNPDEPRELKKELTPVGCLVSTNEFGEVEILKNGDSEACGQMPNVSEQLNRLSCFTNIQERSNEPTEVVNWWSTEVVNWWSAELNKWPAELASDI